MPLLPPSPRYTATHSSDHFSRKMWGKRREGEGWRGYCQYLGGWRAGGAAQGGRGGEDEMMSFGREGYEGLPWRAVGYDSLVEGEGDGKVRWCEVRTLHAVPFPHNMKVNPRVKDQRWCRLPGGITINKVFFLWFIYQIPSLFCKRERQLWFNRSEVCVRPQSQALKDEQPKAWQATTFPFALLQWMRCLQICFCNWQHVWSFHLPAGEVNQNKLQGSGVCLVHFKGKLH